ncbi:MAG: NUDIX domain-containing protein [Pseudomonadota bacterium]
MIQRLLQSYWRMSRPMTLGAQGCILTPDNKVLLIKHSYRAGWHFPGGGIEKRESALEALRRELFEEANVECTATPELFGIYSNFEFFPGDHIILFVVRNWSQPSPPKPNREITHHGFFAMDELPADIHKPTARRLAEILDGKAIVETW